MSWFDASGFASIAKTALREAQKTIDKALDIKDDDPNSTPTNTPIDTNSDDFFETWGANQTENINETNKIENENEKSSAKMQSSLWGSFTGSFFDGSREAPLSPSLAILEDSFDMKNEFFTQSKLVMQHSEDGDSFTRQLSNDPEDDTITEETQQQLVEIQLELDPLADNNDSVKKRDTSSSSSLLNRLSVISSESGKNDSDSVELLTTPESELVSADFSFSTSGSAKGAKLVSDSVEILIDSLTSPSSVEVLDLDSSESRNQQEDVSPLESPLLDEETRNFSPCVEKSNDPADPLPEDQEESVAEDTMSYTSISESTSATVLDQAFTHLKPQKMLKDTYNSPMSESNPDLSQPLPDAITRAPSRGGLHLPLPQVLIDTQPQSSRQDLTNLLKNTNIIDIPADESEKPDTQPDDDGSQSDRTVIATMDSSSDTSVIETSYLKNLLADAMAEKSSSEKSDEVPAQNLDLDRISISQLEMPRESSPGSSESRSDLVKIGSDHTSGHTSGDDLETTTSSDIEIISSPNCDSSSTQSRQSPSKLVSHRSKSEDTKVELLCKMTMKKAKGHTRELSETSSISDDSHCSEVDRLIRRISEITEILESRESKLGDMNRRNAELQELNNSLKHQLDTVLTKQLESADVSQVTEEYTQRLSALEKKFQQAIREKDTLRKQLEQSKQEAATRMSKSELETVLSEKDDTIKELREEGEKLSKQQLQHSNIIKKLRVKEKETETTIKHLKETIEGLSSETERLQRLVAAKEEVERSQIEAVHKLTAKNKKLDSELVKVQSLHEDLTQKYETAKKSLDAAKKELVDKNRTSSELVAREHRLESLENAKRQTEDQNEAIIAELESLRSKLRQSDVDYVKKEQSLRKENSDLLRRLEDAEARNEELSQSVLEVSKPLVRQLDSLQATHTIKMAHFERIEQDLSLKINELQSRLQASVNTERLVKDESVTLRSRLSDLESEVSSLKHQNGMVKMQLEQQETEKQIAEQDLMRQIDGLKENLKKEKQKIEELSKDAHVLQEELNVEKERKKSTSLLEHNAGVGRNSPQAGSNSPTLSLGKVSVADSLGSSFWSQEDNFDVSQTPRYTNMFEMQMFQSNLKQRDGEVQQLQWELNRREQERSLLNSEISNLLTRVDDLEIKVKDHDLLNTQFIEVQQQYDTLCQLYGEKVEENEELKLDLQDVKDMYKGQIDELMRQQKANK